MQKRKKKKQRTNASVCEHRRLEAGGQPWVSSSEVLQVSFSWLGTHQLGHTDRPACKPQGFSYLWLWNSGRIRVPAQHIYVGSGDWLKANSLQNRSSLQPPFLALLREDFQPCLLTEEGARCPGTEVTEGWSSPEQPCSGWELDPGHCRDFLLALLRQQACKWCTDIHAGKTGVLIK